MHHRPIVPDHGTQYEENPRNYHRGMCEDGMTDGLDPLLDSLILLKQSGK